MFFGASAPTGWRAVPPKERIIAQNQNTFAKRQREMEKKAKADKKRARRTQRKNGEDTDTSQEPTSLVARMRGERG